jgi:CPA2 family monovalent cation:H+ antiporter-2
LVAWFDRVAPKPVVQSLAIYTRWVGQLGTQRQANQARRLAWRWCAQMALNAALVTAVFIAAAFVQRRPPEWLAGLGLAQERLKAVLWLAAMVLSLPMLIATFRKLQALGLLVADMKVQASAAGERTAAIRALVAQVVPFTGTVALGLYILVLSSTLLPSLKVTLALILIVAFIAWLLWRSFIRVYSKAQIALQETFAQPPAPRPQAAPAALPSLLREADLETVPIAPGAAAARKLIRELELRTHTGASIVGIERNGTNIINPLPDEELQPGDQVLLLGTRAQLDAAKSALTAERAADGSEQTK